MTKYRKLVLILCLFWFVSFLVGFASRPKGVEEPVPVKLDSYGIVEIKKEMKVATEEINAILKDNQFMGVEGKGSL